MTATDPAITWATFIKFEAPAGNVLLCDGGMLEYDSEKYESYDSVYGSIYQPESIEAAFGDMAEGGSIRLAPNPDATVSDWWRTDLENSRIRFWCGEVDSDGYTVTTAKLLHDMTVDTISREQAEGGVDVLTLKLIGRAEKLFLIREGNVCSGRHHESVYTGEKGFLNCTDIAFNIAWGVAGQTSGVGAGGGRNGDENRNMIEF